MQARMENPALRVPGALTALTSLSAAAASTGLDATLLELVHLRASQINNCGVCVAMHSRDLAKAGESDERIWAVAAWRESPWFSDAERAALRLTEELTRIADRPEAVPDEVWREVSAHFDELALAGLILSIGAINIWNRVNLSTRQIAS